jgi:hypothetical protein
MADTLSLEQKLVEDPTSFLVRIKSLCPDILSLLGRWQAKLLSKDPSTPYDSKNVNEEYLREVGAVYSLMAMRDTGLGAVQKSMLKPMAKTKQLNMEEVSTMKEAMDQVFNRHTCI